MTTQRTLLTAEEFYLFCCQSEGRYELVDGEVVELAPPNDEHGEIAGYIVTAFNNYSRRRGTGRARVETGYRLRIGPDTVRGADVSFVLRPRVEGRGSASFPARRTSPWKSSRPPTPPQKWHEKCTSTWPPVRKGYGWSIRQADA